MGCPVLAWSLPSHPPGSVSPCFPLSTLMRSSALENSGMLFDHLLKFLCDSSILIGAMQRKNLSNNPGDFLVECISLPNVVSEAVIGYCHCKALRECIRHFPLSQPMVTLLCGGLASQRLVFSRTH